MFRQFLGSYQEDTRFTLSQELTLFFPLLQRLRNKEIELRDVAPAKHKIISSLLTDFDEAINHFNAEKACVDHDSEVKAILNLVNTLKAICAKVANSNIDTNKLLVIRNNRRQNVKDSVQYGPEGVAWGLALFAPLTFAGGLALIAGTRMSANLVSKATGLDDTRPDSARLVSSLFNTLNEIKTALVAELERNSMPSLKRSC